MNLNPIIEGLSNQSVTGLPTNQDEYDGQSDKYIVFVYEDERPAEHGDDKVLSDIAYIRITLYTPKNFNYFEVKDKIRNYLEETGFCVTSIESYLAQGIQATSKIRNTVFETNYTKNRMEDN